MSRLPYLASAAWTCLAFGCIAGDEAKSLPLKLVTHKVQREKLQPMIVERATVESATSDQIVCPVKSRTPASTVATTIKRMLVEDGDKVVKDQLLVELDASGLEEQLKTQQIARDMAAMNLSQAEEQLAVVKAQNVSDQKAARLALELALGTALRRSDLVTSASNISATASFRSAHERPASPSRFRFTPIWQRHWTRRRERT